MDDKNEARADGGRRFQREGSATEKDLDLAIVAPACQGSVEEEEMKQRSEVEYAYACIHSYLRTTYEHTLYTYKHTYSANTHA